MNEKTFSPERLRAELKNCLPGRAALKALSYVYLACISARKTVYDLGLLPRRRLGVPVICFGNISAGGTGKTSTVVNVATALARAGRKPAILIRGYKRAVPPKTLTILAKGREAGHAEAGDEALMLYRMLEGLDVPVLVCADRFASGTAAVKELGADILLMDDGYQYFSLYRDADIALVNAAAPFTRDFMLPYGNLREPAKGLARAGAVVITHCEQTDAAGLAALRGAIAAINPSALVLESSHVPEFFFSPATDSTVPLADLKGAEAAALSGLGDPASFEAALKSMDIKLAQIWRYPDHHVFTPAELASARSAAQARPVITTYKDFARFPADWRDHAGANLLILSVKIAFRSGDGEKLSAFVSARGLTA